MIAWDSFIENIWARCFVSYEGPVSRKVMWWPCISGERWIKLIRGRKWWRRALLITTQSRFPNGSCPVYRTSIVISWPDSGSRCMWWNWCGYYSESNLASTNAKSDRYSYFKGYGTLWVEIIQTWFTRERYGSNVTGCWPATEGLNGGIHASWDNATLVKSYIE